MVFRWNDYSDSQSASSGSNNESHYPYDITALNNLQQDELEKVLDSKSLDDLVALLKAFKEDSEGDENSNGTEELIRKRIGLEIDENDMMTEVSKITEPTYQTRATRNKNKMSVKNSEQKKKKKPVKYFLKMISTI